MANNLFQSFIDTAKTIAGYPITVANGVFMRNGKTLDETEEELITALGPTDISSYADGTITGSIKAACDKSDANETAIADVNSKLGNTDISSIGDGTVTGGLSMLSNNAYDLKMLGWTVPKECPVQNYVDEDGVFHQIVGRVDLSKLMWEWADTLNEFRTDRYIMGMNLDSTNIYCSKYQFGSEMYISGMGIYIKDPNYDSSTISQFKADNKGVYFYYELATEITKPIDGNEAIKLLNDKLGNTNISGIGDGTVTGGLNALNSNLENCFIISSEYSDTVPSGTTNYYEPILTASIPDRYKLFAITGLRTSVSSIYFYSIGRRITHNQIQIGFKNADTPDLSGVVYSYRFIFIKENMISIH